MNYKYKKQQEEYCKKCERIGRELFKDFMKDSLYYVGLATHDLDRRDFVLLAENLRGVYGEIKTYRNPKYPRIHSKFKDFQIDYDKLDAVETKAKENGFVPLLVCFFTDCLMIWRLDTIDWRSTRKDDVEVNVYGGLYGIKKEYEPQAYLNFKDAIYTNFDIHA